MMAPFTFTIFSTLAGVGARRVLFGRAVDPDLGPTTGGQFHSSDMDIAITNENSGTNGAGGSGDNPKHVLAPHFNNLTPWPYVAMAFIGITVSLALGYAIYSCMRSIRVKNRARANILGGSESVQTRPTVQLKPIGAEIPMILKTDSPAMYNAKSTEVSPTHSSFLDFGSDSDYSLEHNRQSFYLDDSDSSGKKAAVLSSNPGLLTVTLPSQCYIPYTPTTPSINRQATKSATGFKAGRLKRIGKRSTPTAQGGFFSFLFSKK
ncbi:hypothetical protein FA15DRAFT_506305 [Coprinopsis marcescibilis]|uniref:Uncharacterized protein n=1 Tax=Coprinopsis marcescibilis TaxID=230819 RepID=A0A5C3L7H0_COPMA|nr:hypothetical protein FA15DRAFT_506305 [Coprinopsis marcescibilis]